MTRPELPPARYSVIIILSVGIIFLFIRGYIGTSPRVTILAAGLFLDIIGACILAIPDIPTVHRFFFSGMVRSAFDHLKLEYGEKKSILIKPGIDEETVIPLVSSISEVSYNFPDTYSNSDIFDDAAVTDMKIRELNLSTDGFYELRQVFSEGRADPDWNRVFAFITIKNEDGGRVTYTPSIRNEELKLIVQPPFKESFDKVENKLRQSDERFRRMGLSLLIAGFFFQGLSLTV